LRHDVLRRVVGIAGEIEIFEGTIAENVHLHRLGISKMDVRDTLDRLGILESILTLPDGIETKLLPSGRPLSKTHCELLMLARALIGRPQILLVDGILDALPETVMYSILPQIFDQRNQFTLILVTGRRDLVDLCDAELNLGKKKHDFQLRR
jgi:putative ABC transport system ATP-binding protein